MKKVTIFALFVTGIIACQSNSDYYFNEDSLGHGQLDNQLTTVLEQRGGDLSFYKLPESTEFDKIPQDPKNPLSRAKVELGKLLFHETALASDSRFPETKNTYSCASCHHAAAGFQANVAQGIGDGGMGFGQTGEGRIINPLCANEDIDVQPIRSPSALNIAYQTNILWNGQFGATAINSGTDSYWEEGTPKAVNKLGYEGTETQAIAGLDVHRFGLSIDQEFIATTDYKELFDVAFGDWEEDERYGSESAGLAIAAYERTLLANESPFQKWLSGDSEAMSPMEKQGALLFFKHNCDNCHTGPAMSSMSFHAYGMKDLYEVSSAINVSENDGANLGRGGFTQNPDDNYKFKVPQLYNLQDSKFYGHGSSFTSIKDVIRYKNEGIAENGNVSPDQLSSDFRPLGMTEMEINQLTEFITKSLYDPNLERYVPSALPSGLCFPNNDALSKVDLDCI